MDGLEEGKQYTLSTKDEISKSLYFVKLTDSALQSIDTHLTMKEDPSCKPTIEFKHDSGVISLPINGNKHNYVFTLSNIESDGLQGSFQCLQSNKRCLKSLGLMLKRMHINAKEDSYEKTKFKMAAADKEQKSFCTKEIKSNGTRLGRCFPVKRLGLKVSEEKLHATAKQLESATKFNFKNKLVNSSSVLKQPIRKRVIHILAIKPYKRPDLLLRLIKEGIHNKDKKKLNSVLKSVGMLKEDVYNLKNSLWGEVEDTWEFCTKEELQVIQRKKQQSLRLCNENVGLNSKLYKCSSVQKVVLTEPIIESEPFSKKRRISHNGPKITDPGVKDNSIACKTVLPSISNHQKLPYPSHGINGNGLEERNYALHCEKDTPDRRYDMSSKKQSVSGCNLNLGESSKYNCGSGQLKTATKNIFSNSHNKTCLSRVDLDNHSDVQTNHKTKNQREEKESKNYEPSATNIHLNLSTAISDNHPKAPVKHVTKSVYERKDSARYEYPNLNMPQNKTSHIQSVPIMDKSKMISPIGNSPGSSFFKTDNSKYLGFNKENFSVTDLNIEFDNQDFMQLYNTIDSREQRTQYADEFNMQYDEYLKLHAEMKLTSEKFLFLENSLNECAIGSSQFKKIRAKIEKESKSILLNCDYIHAWKKYNYLKSKLSLIKKLIVEYDSLQGTES